MPLADLPTELILLIASHLSQQQDLNAFAQTSHQLHAIINPYLYHWSIRNLPHAQQVLLWGIEQYSLGTITHCIEAGADISTAQYHTYLDESFHLRVEGELPLLAALEHRASATERYQVEKGLSRGSMMSGEWMHEMIAEIDKWHTVILLLLKHGADINGANREMRTPLHEAAAQGDEEVVQLLLDWGADVAREDQCGRQPLYAAAQGGNTTVLALLLERGAELDHRAKDAQGTALHVAVYWKNREAVEFLLARGADPNSRTANWQETPLHSAARAADGGSRGRPGQLASIVQILLHYAADIDAVNCAGITPLKWVVLFGRSREVARALIENGANVEVVDDEGRTLMELARERNRLYMMELFADSAPSSMLPERPKGPVERDTEHREQRRSQADSNMELQGQLCRLGGPRKRNLFSRALLGVFRHRGARET